MTEQEARERARRWWTYDAPVDPGDQVAVQEAIAALILSVAAEQRERDARVCDRLASISKDGMECFAVISEPVHAERHRNERAGCIRCAAAIRAGGES